jgi:hypothetical protein
LTPSVCSEVVGFFIKKVLDLDFGGKNSSFFYTPTRTYYTSRVIRKKIAQFLKNSPKSRQVKKAKISTMKLILKTKNINIKPLLKP